MTLQHDTTEVERVMMRNLIDYDMIPAKVISNSKGTKDNYLVLDRGSNHGVKEKMGVIGGSGVVGVVYVVGADHCLVIPITNSKSSISCRIQGQTHFGYLQWTGKSMQRASLDEIPRHAQVEQGGVVETSGHSSVFPPGILVGKIENIGNSEDGQSYTLDISLATDFSTQQSSLLELLNALEQADMMDQVDGIRLDDLSVIRMDYDSRFTVKMPYGADYVQKLKILQMALDSEYVQENMTGTFNMMREDGKTYLEQNVRE
jgi:rod shape-determining protein MreC